jgi:hypothetical protein
MPHEFLTSNRKELIPRSGKKVAKRFAPLPEIPAAVDHCVPPFLQQLLDMGVAFLVLRLLTCTTNNWKAL